MDDKINKIANQDCLEYLKELPDGCVDLILIDPPYLIDIEGGKKFFEGRGGDRQKLQKALEPISKGFSSNVLDEICRVCKKINCYIFCSKKQVPILLNYFIEKKCNFDILTWHKNNPIPMCGDSYLPDTEYILFFREKRVFFGGDYSTKKKFYISNLNTADKKIYLHPTCKPVDLLKKYIINSTKENDIVLDCFMGSGSTAIASLETKRRFLGCERDPEYCKIANERLENWKADLERQDKWLNDRGVGDFESGIPTSTCKTHIEEENLDLFD